MRLEIYTEQFQRELTSWVMKNNYCPCENDKTISSIRFKDSDGLEERIFDLIEEAALSKTQIIKENQKLKERVKNMVFTPCRDDIEENIKQYVRDNEEMNIEGYINFRMGEYMDMVDLIVYMVLKSSIE